MKEELEGKFLDSLNSNLGIIHRVCRIYFTDADERQDMFQEIVYQLWKSYPGFQENSKFSTWAYRVALNTAIGGIRKRYKAIKEEPLSERLLQIAESDHAGTDDRMILMYKSIQKLSDIDKAIVLLYLEGSDNEETASVVGITSNYVSVKLVRIKKQLQELMKKRLD